MVTSICIYHKFMIFLKKFPIFLRVWVIITGVFRFGFVIFMGWGPLSDEKHLKPRTKACSAWRQKLFVG